MSPLLWRRALKPDIPALADFLRAEEDSRVGFSGRLLAEKASLLAERPGSPAEAARLPRGGCAGSRELRLPSTLRGAVWIADGRPSAKGGDPSRTPLGIAGAVLFHPSRLAFPILPAEGEGDRDLALLASSFAAASVIGMAQNVERYESALGIAPRVSVAYRLMSRARVLAPGEPPRDAPAYPGLSVRRASPEDLDALLYLQEAYEREEVLTPIHEFNRAACRASLARALDRQLVLAAEEGGVLVGKAGTNARGFLVDQVGGVYTMPERRGRGVALALMTALLAEIEGAGRRPALFVKPTNAPARSLYGVLGFEDIGDYRADYFEA